MCGIVAMYSARGPIPADVLERATLRLAHRGPDGQRTWLADDRRVGMGHARLSIIDLATGDQPIASEDESLRIVVNGEFYDFEREQRDLEGRGHRLRTRSDSEIALHLYEDYGTACLRHLRGEFAFVLWDGPNDTLFAARDRFGIKPLYYTTYRGTLYLASEIKSLLAAGVPARWDRATFFQANHFLGIPTPQDRTLFEGIYQVPPGHYLLASGRQVRLIRYWDFEYPAAVDARQVAPDVEYAERFRHALDEAVRLRLRADVPVGCYLSGGLDSCAVLGLAATHRTEPIRAFTLTFERAAYDEGAIAREMAAQRRGRLPSNPDPAIRPRRSVRRRHLASRDAFPQRSRRRQVLPELGRARRRLQGRADRRRLRRDPGRLCPLPPGPGALQRPGARRGGGPAAPGAVAGEQPGIARPPSLRWRGTAAHKRPPRPGFRTVVAGGPRHGGDPARRIVRARLRLRVCRARSVPRLPERPRRGGSAHRPRAGEPVALPVVQGDAPELHPGRAGRPDGDGAFGGGPSAVP